MYNTKIINRSKETSLKKGEEEECTKLFKPASKPNKVKDVCNSAS